MEYRGASAYNDDKFFENYITIEPEGIPAEIMIALIGAPYFMYLLMKQ
ncbi:hypothetical protein J7J00_14925 [Bacillus sp. ISL-4]|nr:hypothetical protein [Bacillus sp. ISL-4]MBT2666791.1 hypothetical protein [Bacillus sp. ISL-4]MBT2674323.1 hypothetical protein [Streptomyces sp. ISL-14]